MYVCVCLRSICNVNGVVELWFCDLACYIMGSSWMFILTPPHSYPTSFNVVKREWFSFYVFSSSTESCPSRLFVPVKLVRSILLSPPCPPVALWVEWCPLCVLYNTCRIHYISIHLINQRQMVCRVLRFITNVDFAECFYCLLHTLVHHVLAVSKCQVI